MYKINDNNNDNDIKKKYDNIHLSEFKYGILIPFLS